GTASSRDDRWPARDSNSTTTDADPLPSRTVDLEPTRAPEPVRRVESVTIPAESVIGVQIETTTTSETARVEDTVRARVTRDVLSRGTVVVPAGSRLVGSVTLVEDGGRIRERARLGVRFHTLVLADGTEVRLPTETIYRDGESPAKGSAAKIGGAAAGGAILGAILGGTRGAIIGAATGAGGGTAAAMAGERKPAELRSGQAVTVRVSSDVETQVER
ncbi:MAG TPA: TrbI/VirB10 family protein, partial [Luteitalea sp.]|nr:TrbI/VirB10 family protein [Luteitalea sp.]